MRIRILLAGLGVALLLAMGPLARPSHAGVNDFKFSSFKADYYLSKNQAGQSTVQVTETFVAEFPEFNQNKGMVRAIPDVYQNHPLKFELISVTRNGQPEPIYSQYSQNQNQVVETGTDEYLRGTQTYNFKYNLTNVTQEVGDSQEFYWNVIGNQFDQPFLAAETAVRLAPNVKTSFTNQLKCFAGNNMQKVACQASYDEKTATATFKVLDILPPKSSMTVAMQFEPETFLPYQPSAWEYFLANYALYIVGVGTLIASVASWRILRKYQAPKTNKAPIPEYLPPKDLSIMETSGLVKLSGSPVVSAQAIDLAVRHNIRIIESQQKQLFGKKDIYTIELLSISGLRPDEAQFLEAMLGSLDVGSRYTFKNNDYKVGAKISQLVQKAQTTSLIQKGYLHTPIGSKFALCWLGFVLAVIVAVAILGLQITPSPTAWSIIFSFLSLFISFVVLLVTSSAKIYTKKGRQEQHYLEGLKMYIKLAEADRLKYLQGPAGAERAAVDTESNEQMIKLYERLLPFAVLFHLEKDWTKTLETKYQDASNTPDWYMGSNLSQGLRVGAFVSSFNSSATRSFAAPSSSGGSGISGGFAGGGGGGGGGGGR